MVYTIRWYGDHYTVKRYTTLQKEWAETTFADKTRFLETPPGVDEVLVAIEMLEDGKVVKTAKRRQRP